MDYGKPATHSDTTDIGALGKPYISKQITIKGGAVAGHETIREGRSVANFNGTIDCLRKLTAENMFLVKRSRKHGFGEIHGGERGLFSTSDGLLSRLPVTFGIVPERLDGFFNQDLAAANSEWDRLFTNPADQGQTVM